jgi:hypothetical protein
VSISVLEEGEYEYNPANDIVETEATLRQRLAFDIAPDAMLAADPDGLGLHPCSQDVFDAEMEASRLRRNNIGPAIPFLSIMSRLSSEVLNAAMLVRQEEDPDLDMDEVTPEQIHAASVGILANLVDLGFVHLPHPETGDES